MIYTYGRPKVKEAIVSFFLLSVVLADDKQAIYVKANFSLFEKKFKESEHVSLQQTYQQHLELPEQSPIFKSLILK